jgi:hypothetical protein
VATGRLHVFLHDLHTEFKERYPYKGQMSKRVRELIQLDLEDGIMILDKEILALIDKGDYDGAVTAMLPGLKKFRETRLAEGQRKMAAKRKKASDKGKKKGGVKTEEESKAAQALEELMKGYTGG